MTSKELGDLGEKIAKNFLKKKGYKILDQNYIPKWARGPEKKEIDIIAKPHRNVSDILRGKKDDVIHFIEVKTLSGENKNFSPEDKVDFIKQRKIIKAAESYLLEKKKNPETKWQIDVIAIKIDLNLKKAKVKHLKNVT